MKQVLFISYFFPPIYSVESTMALNSVKYLSRYGWEPVVVTTKASKEFGKDVSGYKLLPTELKIVRSPSWENLWSRGVNWLGIVPDAMFGWQKAAVRTNRLIIKSHNIAAIVSRANPITSHLIAEALHCQLGGKVPWVVLFGDPWTQNPYIKYRWFWVKPYRERIEAGILRKASAIVVTTELTKQLLVSKYGLADKIHVLPNTYDPAEFANIGVLPVLSQGTHRPMVLTYAGNLYGLRSPESLFKALQLIQEHWPEAKQHLRLRLIGSIGKFADLLNYYQIGSMVEIVGQLPRRQALQELSQSDVLVSIDASHPLPSIFLPAKLMDYLALQKPILAITPAGETANLVQATATGLAVSPEDPAAIAMAIEQYYQLFCHHQLILRTNSVAVNHYSAVEYAKTLSSLLDQLSDKSMPETLSPTQPPEYFAH